MLKFSYIRFPGSSTEISIHLSGQVAHYFGFKRDLNVYVFLFT